MNREPYGIFYVSWLNDQNLKHSELILLLRLSNLSATDGFAYPSNEYLAEKMGCDPCTISRHISSLIKKGYIKVKYEKNGALVKKRLIFLVHFTIDKNVKPRLTKLSTTIDKNVKENNTSINIKSINIKKPIDLLKSDASKYEILCKQYFSLSNLDDLLFKCSKSIIENNQDWQEWKYSQIYNRFAKYLSACMNNKAEKDKIEDNGRYKWF